MTAVFNYSYVTVLLILTNTFFVYALSYEEDYQDSYWKEKINVDGKICSKVFTKWKLVYFLSSIFPNFSSQLSAIIYGRYDEGQFYWYTSTESV